jgi:hypothetical protein
MHKLEGYNVFGGSKVKEQEREHKKRWRIVCSIFFEKIVLNTSSIPAHIYFIFSPFGVISNLMDPPIIAL